MLSKMGKMMSEIGDGRNMETGAAADAEVVRSAGHGG
jgi:hypothetical protein